MVAPGQVWDMKVGLMAASLQLLKLQVTASLCLEAGGISLTNRLYSDTYMSFGLLERDWFSDFVIWKLSKTKASPWGLAVHGLGYCLKLSHRMSEWQNCGWENLGSQHQMLPASHPPALMPPRFFLGLVLLVLTQRKWCIWVFGSMAKDKGPWLSCFNNSQQGKEMHWGIYRKSPGLAIGC